MLENPQKLREIVSKSGAKSTDLQSPESAEHLCSKCDKYAACWASEAESLWNGSKDQAYYLEKMKRKAKEEEERLSHKKVASGK